jgi:uncharacterized protein (UPF0147 family)
MIKETEKEEARLWALQAENNRRLQVLQDRKMKQNTRTVAESAKEHQMDQADENKLRWKDPYGDRS